MAKKNAPAKQGEKNFFQKFIGFSEQHCAWGSFGHGPELKKVTWPTRKGRSTTPGGADLMRLWA